MSDWKMVKNIDESLTPPGYWGSDSSHIHVVENFVTEEESQILNCYIRTNAIWVENAEHEAWNNRVHNTNLFTEEEAKTVSQTLIDRVKCEIESTMSVELGPNVPSIVRWLPGNGQAPHADKQLLDGTPNSYPENDIASLIYINDDYDGGEIFFPNQSIQLKPPKNSLIFFPGDVFFLHGVTTVSSGIRYTIPSFWKVVSIQ